MPKVRNWQIGREMDFTYPEHHPRWQFAFVFNINRCIGCQTCTLACKSTWTFSEGQEHMWWNNVETKPFGGYPHHWDARLLQLLEKRNPGGQTWAPQEGRGPQAPYGTFKGKTVFEARPMDLARPSAICPPTRSGTHPTSSRIMQSARPTAPRRPSCQSIRSGTSTSRACAIIAPTRPAWLPVRDRQSTSAQRTASS
jgi:ferredoxin